MTTHRTEDLAAGDVTTWLRDEATGLVTNKVYADGMGPAYGYTPDGRPTRTTWARGAWFENVYDGQGRVVQVLHDDATLDAALEYDALGRPVARNADAFGYDALGQVVSARFGADADPDLYAYDRIGNFTSNCLRNAWAQFEANELNEYVSITNHPNHPTHQNHPNNPNYPDHLNLSYDSDGNLLTNGVWSYAYDSHNRLTTVWSNDVFVLENRYDFASRRILRRTPAATHRYCYDGWNPVCEIVVSGDATNRVDYFWGKDLSGTLQGAGGVGGLLAVRTGGVGYYPAYDNIGNVVAYSDSVGALVASYAYDAFGNMRAASGPLASAFAHRFSTKPLDPETGLYYYGYRFYAPVLGRWMNRDPMMEVASQNIFSFCDNDSTERFDTLGLFMEFPYFDPNFEFFPNGMYAPILMPEISDPPPDMPPPLKPEDCDKPCSCLRADGSQATRKCSYVSHWYHHSIQGNSFGHRIHNNFHKGKHLNEATRDDNPDCWSSLLAFTEPKCGPEWEVQYGLRLYSNETGRQLLWSRWNTKRFGDYLLYEVPTRWQFYYFANPPVLLGRWCSKCE